MQLKSEVELFITKGSLSVVSCRHVNEKFLLGNCILLRACRNLVALCYKPEGSGFESR
jgi:hypothetical protein